MQFYNTQYLTAFWSLAIVAGSFMIAAKLRRKRLARLGTLKTVLRMSNFSQKKHRRRNLALFLAFAMGLIALAQPQWGAEKKQIERKGVDVIFLLDTSLSMLVQDTKPSRLEKAKIEIRSFVKKFKGDRVGIIAFAGSSFLQCPLTLDYAAFFLFLDAINVGYIPDPGSSLEDALENAAQSFPSGEKRHRAIIIFSDGEFHGEALKSAIEKAVSEGITIYCIGLGTTEGEPIPLKTE
ncbi:MAG TPA: VWA domain-containing protein, partial [Candidatus Omnitrophota bacterium]|nr:VWA domain-containing protein [Candidatus Omnitrophota bacterium]